jgi:hypothetical protein
MCARLSSETLSCNRARPRLAVGHDGAVRALGVATSSVALMTLVIGIGLWSGRLTPRTQPDRSPPSRSVLRSKGVGYSIGSIGGLIFGVGIMIYPANVVPLAYLALIPWVISIVILVAALRRQSADAARGPSEAH